MISVKNRFNKRLDKLQKELKHCEKSAKRAERDGDLIKLGQIRMTERAIIEDMDTLRNSDQS